MREVLPSSSKMAKRIDSLPKSGRSLRRRIPIKYCSESSSMTSSTIGTGMTVGPSPGCIVNLIGLVRKSAPAGG